MKILVIGMGGVGGYLAARLTQAKLDVTVVARGAHGRVLSERGLTVKSYRGDELVPLARVVLGLETLRTRFDLVLVAVKADALEAACDALPNVLAANGVVLPLLNGLTSEDEVARYVGAQRTLAGVAYMSAGIASDGIVYAHGAARLGLAPYRPGQEAELRQLADLFTRAEVPVLLREDASTLLWEKMVWNAPFNAVCALTRRASGACLEHNEALVRRAMEEVLAVARAEGVALPDALIEHSLRITRDEFPDAEPSMLQDVRRGRPTEVEILQGEVVRRADRHGVAVPVLRTLAELVRGLA